ncbi:MAG: adenylosuccinate lyase [Firmicutes bacterium]|nr:adenylosuccinate lyase [Bacillota bacterium]
MIARYARTVMQELWSDQTRYNRWLLVERLAVEAWEQLGKIPAGVAERLKKASVDPERVLSFEAIYQHDIIAFISAASETVDKEDAKYIHFGLTSTDVVDSALSSLIVEALDIIREDMLALRATLRNLALQHKDTPVMGRTHGMHAEPTSLGLKFALWWLELGRQLDRLDHAQKNIAVIKISGAVGNYANIPPFIEEYVAEHLHLRPAPLSTQVLQRDRHAEVILCLALIGSTLDKMATELRHLQRSEVGEMEEPFATGQRGSSAMPHKRNPVKAEQISGLSRLLRGFVVPALEDIALWHERDISHSSVERIMIADATTLTDYLLTLSQRIFSGLTVKAQRMRENIELSGGLVFSQKVLLALVDAGMTREDAYKIVQGHAMAAMQERSKTFRERLQEDSAVTRYLSLDQLAALFDIAPYLSQVDDIYRRIGLNVDG